MKRFFEENWCLSYAKKLAHKSLAYLFKKSTQQLASGQLFNYK